MSSIPASNSEKQVLSFQGGEPATNPSSQGTVGKIHAVSKETLDKLNNWKNLFQIFLIVSAATAALAAIHFYAVGSPIGLIVAASLFGATLAIPGGASLYYHMKVKKLEKAGE